MEFDAEGFGRRLRLQRMRVHLTQEQLAAKVGIATNSYGALESGSHRPSLNTLIKLCSVLDIGVDELLADSLPVADVYLDKDIADILADCTAEEKRTMAEGLSFLKKVIRNN